MLYTYLRFMSYKNCNIETIILVAGIPTAILSWLYIFVFTFLPIKIEMQKKLMC